MERRHFLGAAAATALAPRAFAATPAKGVYDRALVIDALGGPGGSYGETPGAGLSAKALADVRESGLTAINVTVSEVGNAPDAYQKTLENIAAQEREIAAHPDVFLHVRKAADLKAAKATGRCGIIYGFQDSMPFGPTLERLPMFDNLGLRICQPTYNRRNLAGDGSIEAANGGLSKLGFDLIAALNERRILTDFSHAGVRTIDEGIAASKRPPAITHSGCRALREHPRNVSDAAIKALSDKGGVIGIYFMPYLTTDFSQPKAADVIRHIEHAWQVGGEDHVGLGTDGSVSATVLTDGYKKAFAKNVADRKAAGIGAPGETETGYLFAADLNTPRRFETLAGMLLARGHSTVRVEKLLGANFARLFGEVWG
jgi:membrane dipeptidase